MLDRLNKRCVPFYTALLICAAFAVAAAAQEPAPNRTGIDWLDWATEQVAFTMREATPAEDGTNEAAERDAMPVLSPTHSIETMEMMRLQQEIRLLRELIEEGVVNRVIALEAEVHDLKSALNGQRGTGPVIPQPDAPPRAQIPAPGPAPARDAALDAAMEHLKAQVVPPPAAFNFTIIDEWGRSPEIAAELGGDATTLIGIAGVVPPGSKREDVLALTEELRTKYAKYDNVIIEVFDSESAAETFASQQTVNAERRVLSISKAKAEGRDLALYFGGEIPEPVPAK